MTARHDGRAGNALRSIQIDVNTNKWAEGSVTVAFGDTRVQVTVSVEDRVPGWMRDEGRGWLTAEYAMLPRATDRRTPREARLGRIGGRTHEISRLIGRSLRAGVDLRLLGQRTLTVDCDVLQADGGTRTAAITGAWVAVARAAALLKAEGRIKKNPLTGQVAAVSVGMVDGECCLDLDYKEDQKADTDLNIVMRDDALVEVQGTAEGMPFSRSELDRMLDVGAEGIAALRRMQRAAVVAP